MKQNFIKCLLLVICLGFLTEVLAQNRNRKAPTRRKVSRTNTKPQSTATIQQAPVDTLSTAGNANNTAAATVDSMPIKVVKKSLRPNDAIDKNLVKDRQPLAYEHIREDDAVFRQKLWREIDIREKINLPFRYRADEDNGNQRFISILFKAIQDGPDNGGVTAFDAIDDRFTTPLSVSQAATKVGGEAVTIPIYDTLGQVTGYKTVTPEVHLDSFYRFRIKEEVIFDKESSRFFWRILGIAPVKNIYTTQGVFVGEAELFWVYYPDLRPIFAKYEVFNAKNFGAKMSWEELFESRMFYGRIIKSTLDNPYDQTLAEYGGLKDNKILQLLEGENIKETIFNYEQNLWSY